MIISIKLQLVSKQNIYFDIYTFENILLKENVSKKELINGLLIEVDNNEKYLIIKNDKYKASQIIQIAEPNTNIVKLNIQTKATTYKHLTNIQSYNYFYNSIHSYIIEYSFTYKYQDELLQSVKDYSKVFKYVSDNDDDLYNNNYKIELNNVWFNKAILYNNQQSTGLLNLINKPQNNMFLQTQYPKYNNDSKDIFYTKTDNFYQYNTFWALQINFQIPLFYNSNDSLSIDKIINQSNMDYSQRNFKKAILRAKDLRIRHILDNTSDVHIVSQFILNETQISYK